MSKRKFGLAVIASFLAVGLVLATMYTVGWKLRDSSPAARSQAETTVAVHAWGDRLERVATAGILIGGVIALVVASWRAWSANQQAIAAQRQVDTALKQTEVSQRGLLDERYQRAAEMIGSPEQFVRVAGIHALKALAYDYPDNYYVQVIGLLCGFVRTSPFRDEVASDDLTGLRQEDINEAVGAIGARADRHVQLEPDGQHAVNLIGADLPMIVFWEANFDNADCHRVNLHFTAAVDSSFRHSRFPEADFSDSEFSGCDFTGASLARADLQRADFSYTTLVGATLNDANCTGTNFEDANFTDAHVSGATFGRHDSDTAAGLTQAQLDSAVADPDNPPILEGVVDDVTRQPLVWHGRSCT